MLCCAAPAQARLALGEPRGALADAEAARAAAPRDAATAALVEECEDAVYDARGGADSAAPLTPTQLSDAAPDEPPTAEQLDFARRCAWRRACVRLARALTPRGGCSRALPGMDDAETAFLETARAPRAARIACPQ